MSADNDHESNCSALTFDGDYKTVVNEARCNCRKRLTSAQRAHSPRQEFEIAMGEGRAITDLSPDCVRAIRNALPFDRS